MTGRSICNQCTQTHTLTEEPLPPRGKQQTQTCRLIKVCGKNVKSLEAKYFSTRCYCSATTMYCQLDPAFNLKQPVWFLWQFPGGERGARKGCSYYVSPLGWKLEWSGLHTRKDSSGNLICVWCLKAKLFLLRLVLVSATLHPSE